MAPSENRRNNVSKIKTCHRFHLALQLGPQQIDRGVIPTGGSDLILVRPDQACLRLGRKPP
jgi:hypothetical protein